MKRITNKTKSKRTKCALFTVFVAAPAIYGASVVEFNSGIYEANELDGHVRITMTCTPPPTNYTVVTLSIVGGTAQEPADCYWNPNLPWEQEARFWPGEHEAAGVLSIVDDGLSELDETVEVSIAKVIEYHNGQPIVLSARLGARTNATLIIHNGVPSLSLSGWPSERGKQLQQETSEANPSAVVAVYRHGDTNESVSVDYTTSDDTAKAGLDFLAQSGTLVLPAGQRTNALSVPIINNGRVDGGRELWITLSNASPGAQILARHARLPIADDEIPVAWDRSFQSPSSIPIGGPFVIQSDGKIICVAAADRNDAPAGTMDSAPVWRFVRLMPSGAVDPTFQSPVLAGSLGPMVLDGQGRLCVGGYVEETSGVRIFVIRMKPDGPLDANIDLPYLGISGYPPQVTGLALQSNRRMVVVSEGIIFRLNDDGSKDTNFADLTLTSAGTIAVTADDKILVTTPATNASGSMLLLRLETNGQFDPTFHAPGCDGLGDYPYISSLKVQNDGKILVVGRFDFIDSHPRTNLVRLNGDGTVDATFASSPGFAGPISNVAVDARGRVLIAGPGGYGPDPHNPNFARFLPDGTSDSTFFSIDFRTTGLLHPSEAGFNFGSFSVLPDGNLLIAGYAQTCWRGYCSSSRPILARLYGDFSTNSAFEFSEAHFAVNPVTGVSELRTFAVDASRDSQYAVSESTGTALISVRRIGDVSGSATIRYASADDTAVDGRDYRGQTGLLQFEPLEAVRSFSIPIVDNELPEPAKTIALSLTESTGVPLIWQSQARLRIVDDDHPGSVDGTFNPPLSSAGEAWLQPDGQVLIAVGGRYGPDDQWYRSLIRLRPDGAQDPSFNAVDVCGWIYPVRDGTVIALQSNRIGRLLPDGSHDPRFSVTFPVAYWWELWFLDSTPDGELIISYPVAGRWRLVRVSADGSFDTRFQAPAFGSPPYKVRVLKDGSILASIPAVYSSDYPYPLLTPPELVHLLPDGRKDSSFALPQLNSRGDLTEFFEQPDGKIIITGDFTWAQGTNSLRGMMRLLPSGTVDPSFIYGQGADGHVTAMAFQADGKLIVAGLFSLFHESPRAGLARLNADGTLDQSFQVGEGLQATYEEWNGGIEWYGGYIKSLAALPNGQILAAGNFTHVNGLRLPVPGWARINGDDQVVITSTELAHGDSAQLTAAVRPRRSYVLEASADLMNWSAISTNASTGPSIELEDATAANVAARFYRLRRWP